MRPRTHVLWPSELAALREQLPELRPVPVRALGDAHPGALSFDSLTRTAESPAVMQAYEAIQPDDHAKYLLTSGSTGHPKVVVNTHRMLCANQQMMRQVWRFLEHEKPVVLDWLPWSHTFGGNHNFNLVLRNGGALWIDEGRPAPGLVEKSVKNLLEVKPTLYFNVPRGFDMLLPFLEKDEALAREFFARLRMVFYAGAALAQSSWERLEAVARKVREEPVWFTTSWGSTETSPAITFAHWRLDRPGVIGLPMPGAELKFVPISGEAGGKLEMRVRGVSVFPGYRNRLYQTETLEGVRVIRVDASGEFLSALAGVADPEQKRRIIGTLFVEEFWKVADNVELLAQGTLYPDVIESATSGSIASKIKTHHNRVDRIMELKEEGKVLEAGTHEDIETLKKEKLQLKDQLYAILKKASAAA